MLWLMLACGDAEDSSAVSPCAQEDRAVDEVLDAVFSGAALTVTVQAMDPAFPAVDDNTWSLLIEDDTGPLTGCTLSGTIDMPDHGHGGPAPEFTESGDGLYEMTARFTMGGYWEVGLTVDCETTDDVLLNVCVEG
ncbi:MAG: hypothetical protein ACI8RZ_005168 [Myxococcota bacterium]|jgi:hypothetical protein